MSLTWVVTLLALKRFICELRGHVTRADSKDAERFPFTFDKLRDRRIGRDEDVAGTTTRSATFAFDNGDDRKEKMSGKGPKQRPCRDNVECSGGHFIVPKRMARGAVIPFVAVAIRDSR
jgi:hypothetical protein